MSAVATLAARFRRLAPLMLVATLELALPASAQRPAERAKPVQGWRHPQAWQQLRLGMSPGEVVAQLGEPGKVTRYYAFTRWEYPDALGLRVNFDERGRLSAWGPIAR